MRRQPIKRFFTREYLFVAVYFFLYAVILLHSDPEWLMWAGPITLGAFPVTAPGVAPPFDPREIIHVASYMVLPGLLALIILARIRGKAHGSRHATIPGPAVTGSPAESHGLAHGAREHRKAA